MKKILSIFMVAVLSLNLLYQPCMAVDDKKEMVSSETQKDTDSECETKANKETAEKSKPDISFLGVILSILAFGALFMWSSYLPENEHSYGNKHSYGDKHSYGNKHSYGSKHSYWDYKSGYENGFRDGVNKCDAKQTGDTFPIDKMSKKCLKQMIAYLHPDKFECNEDIKDFYVKAQEAYEAYEAYEKKK